MKTVGEEVPSGVHSFDMIEYDDKIFVGLGPNYGYSHLVYTKDEFNYMSVGFYRNTNLRFSFDETLKNF